MTKVMKTIREMLKPAVKGKGLQKCMWRTKVKGQYFTVTVQKGDILNGL